MSELSTAECAAGISRSALATFNARNGNGNHRRRPHVPDAPQPATSVPDTKAPVPELTHILLSHERQLDLINVNGWEFRLRKTAWHLGQVDNTILYFTRPELERMHEVVGRILEETPARSEE